MLKSKLGSQFLFGISKDAILSSGGLNFFGCLSSLSISVLLVPVNVSETSHSSGTGSVSSDSFGRPSISSLGSSSTSGSGLSLL